jgi:phospholipase/carboxylesterase
MDYLPCVEIEPSSPATASVIWLHGLGADGNDFAPIVPELNLPDGMAVRFVFPHAPSIPVTINGGMVMPAWYDILDMSMNRKVDYDQIEQSAQEIRKLITRENDRGIESHRIVVAGFSQGGAIAYEVALSYPESLAGLMTLSTYFATAEKIELNEANKNIPIHLFHGTQDPVVHEILGQQALGTLTEMGYKAEYKTYPMPHAVHPQEIMDVSEWLQKVLR